MPKNNSIFSDVKSNTSETSAVNEASKKDQYVLLRLLQTGLMRAPDDSRFGFLTQLDSVRCRDPCYRGWAK